MAFVESKVWTMKPKYWKPGMSNQRPKGPTIEQVPTGVENMQRLRLMMDPIGYIHHPIKYEAKNPLTGEMKELAYPTVEVQQTDILGNKVFDAHQKPVMTRDIDITFDPLNKMTIEESPGVFVEKKVQSMVRVKVSFTLTHGGVKNKYGVKLTLFGPVRIVKQGERTQSDFYEDDEFDSGLLAASVNDGDTEEHPPTETDPLSTDGLPGVESTNSATSTSTSTSVDTTKVGEKRKADDVDSTDAQANKKAK